MMTAVRLMPGSRSRRLSSVVLPLPRKPVMTETGIICSPPRLTQGRGLLLRWTDVLRRRGRDAHGAAAIDAQRAAHRVQQAYERSARTRALGACFGGSAA